MSVKENLVKLTNQLIFWLVAATTLAITLFFLPTTPSFFETNKFAFLLIAATLAAVFWAIRMFAERKFTITRTPLDIPILLLLVVTAIAAISSIDQYISLFGAHGRPWPSFFALAALTVFYFVATSSLKGRKQVEQVLWLLVGGTAIAAVVAILSYFSLYLPFDFATVRSFNPLGQASRLALLETFVIPICLSWAIAVANKFVKFTATTVAAVLIFSFILINFWPAYLALTAGLLVLLVGNLKGRITRQGQSTIAVLAVLTVLFLAIRFVPQVSSITLYSWILERDENLSLQEQLATPTEITLPQRTGWDIAAQTTGKRPLFGTGPGTYQFAYTQLKPRYLNQTDLWSVRFEKSSSDFTELLATTGIFGILAYLLLAIVIVRFTVSLIFKSQSGTLYLPIVAAIISYLVASLFATSSIATAFPFFLGLALLSVLAKATGESHVYDVTIEIAALKDRLAWFPLGTTSSDLVKTSTDGKTGHSQILPGVFLVLVTVIGLLALRHQINAYRADYNYRQSAIAAAGNDGNRAVSFLQRSIRVNPAVDTYHRILAQTSLNAAVNLSSRGNLTDDEQQLLTQLAQVAIDQAKIASGYQILPLRLPGISAANVANWETLAAVYQSLIGSVGGSDVHATNALTQAVNLDPQNPILHDRLGLLYQRLGNLDLAQRKFEDAVIVRGEFGPGHYHLAKVAIEKKSGVARIVSALSAAKQYLPADDPAIPEIDDLLSDYNKQLQDLQTPTPTASPSPGTSPSPSPPTSPSPSPSPSPSL